MTGINDAPVAVNDTDALNEDATVTRSSGANLLMADDTDADDDDTSSITQISVTGGINSQLQVQVHIILMEHQLLELTEL